MDSKVKGKDFSDYPGEEEVEKKNPNNRTKIQNTNTNQLKPQKINPKPNKKHKQW